MQYFVGNDGIFSLNRLDGISIKSLKRNCFAIPTTFLFVAISRWSLCKWVIFCFFSPYFSATLYIFNVIFLEWQRDLFLPKLTYHRNVSLPINRWFSILSSDNLSLVIPNNKRLEHWLLKVSFFAMWWWIYMKLTFHFKARFFPSEKYRLTLWKQVL